MTAPRAPGRRNAAPTPRAGSTAISGRFCRTAQISGFRQLLPDLLGTDTLTLYSIDNGARYEVPYEEAGSDATGNRNFPIALTDDGRILVTDGYIDRSGVAASRYALIDLGAYLAGSREYTAVEMWTE